MSVTTEEAHKLWRALFDTRWYKAAGALRSLAAKRDALKAENARLLKICDDYSTKIYLAQARQARHLAALEPRIARQRRALAKLYRKRHDRKAENARLRKLVAYLAGTNTDHVQVALVCLKTQSDAIYAEARAARGEKE